MLFSVLSGFGHVNVVLYPNLEESIIIIITMTTTTGVRRILYGEVSHDGTNLVSACHNGKAQRVW